MGALYVERVVDQRLDARNKALGVRLLGVALERRLVDPARVDEEQSVTCPRFFIPPERECGVVLNLPPTLDRVLLESPGFIRRQAGRDCRRQPREGLDGTDDTSVGR